MPINNPSTVFCKHVARALIDIGSTRDQAILDYFANRSELLPSSVHRWITLCQVAGKELALLMKTDIAAASSFFGKIVAVVTPEVSSEFYELCSRISDADVYALCSESMPNMDTKYAMASFLLMCVRQSNDLSFFTGCTSALAGRRVRLSSENIHWQRDMMAALFGPVWQVLYADHVLRDDEILQSVFNARAPFMSGVNASSDPKCLPDDVAF